MSRAAAPLLALALLSSSACVERSQPGQASAVRLRRYILDAPPPLAHPLDVSFGGKVRLIGYELEPAGAIAAGQPFTVTMLWQCDERIEPGWQLFTHLLDDRGQRLPGGHVDQVGPLREVSSGRPALPPSEWRPGKVYRDEQPLRMPASASGSVSVSVGLWRDDQRMPVTPPAVENRAVVVRIPTGAARSVTSEAASAAPRPPVPELAVPHLPVRMEPPVIDGKLDDPAWATAASTGPFVDVSTGQPNTSFPVDGSARLLWDDRFLYVAFDVRDTRVRGELRPGERDQHLWEHECVELMIDPDGDGDNRDYYELQVSPQNLVFDSRFDEYNQPRGGPSGPFGHQDWSFTGASAVVVDGTLDSDGDTDRGYRVEMALAWSSFAAGSSKPRPPPAVGDSWRVNLYAMKRNSGVAWSPILGEGNFHRARRFGRLTFR